MIFTFSVDGTFNVIYNNKNLSKNQRGPLMKNPIQYNLKETVINSKGYSAKLIENSWCEDKPNSFCFPPHWHDCYELLLVVSGSLIIRSNDISLELFENQIAVFSPQDIHSGTTGKNGCVYKCLQFELNDLLGNSTEEKTLKSNLKNSSYKIIHRISDKYVVDLFNKTADSCMMKCISQPFVVKGNLCILFSYLLEHFLTFQQATTKIDTKFNDVIVYINDNLRSEINSKLISKKFSYNESYLCRKFKEKTGLSITDYINICRIEYSQKLIYETSLSFSQIAENCGYCNVAYYSTLFKRYTGMTPTTWKKTFGSIK